MEQLDILLLFVRTLAMTFFIVESFHLFTYARHSHIFRVYALIQMAMGAFYGLTIYSNYFSDVPLFYSGQLNLLWNLMIPAMVILGYELLTGRKAKRRYVLANFVPFIFAFLFYSLNSNHDILLVIGYLSLAYTTIMMVVMEVMTVKEIKRHTVRREKYAYIWFSGLMWSMYLSLVMRLFEKNMNLLIVKIIFVLILVVVYGTLTLLLRRGLLDFHRLQQEEPDEPEDDVEPSVALSPVAQTRMSPDDIRSTEQLLNMQEQVSFFDDKARQLKELMDSQQLYLNPELSVADLANELGTNRTYLSNLINQHMKTSFSNYVNSLRVKYAKDLLLSTDDTIEEIYKASGFQSRSTFWRAFSQVEGCTPKDFRHQTAKNTPPSIPKRGNRDIVD